MSLSSLVLTACLFAAGCSSSTETTPGGSTNGSTHPAGLSVPKMIDFGTVQVGSSMDTTIVYRDTGSVALAITGQSIAPEVFTTPDSLTFSIPGGSSRSVRFHFMPSDANDYYGYDSIRTDAKTSDGRPVSVIVTLHGKGIATPPPPPPGITQPGLGSIFIFADSGSSVPDTERIVAQHLNQFGKSDVTSYAAGSLTRYAKYEINGDWSVYEDNRESGLWDGFARKSLWKTYPIGSQATNTYTVFDSSYSNAQGLIQGTLTEKYQYIQTEELAVAGVAVHCILIRYTMTQSVTNDNWQEVRTLWYAPALGWVVRDEGHYTNITTNQQSYSFRMLKSFILK
ncbi:MAG: hypothetical protein Q8922_09385 [Bacteroidota bacterium]|nr:hypothetical protein [Bacteroidota bacterium]MDP4234247.1 hypothetical protein [Bacteroidota bacterium]MDP4243437.1 hypothetical protein [Bacteroidota bacterium]MDP4288136.1 hypothetical protein [Bacteroidota bacterium]